MLDEKLKKMEQRMSEEMRIPDTAVVLSQFIPGQPLSEENRLRVDKAIWLFHCGYCHTLTMSGGCTGNSNVSQADAMRSYAAQKIVPMSRMIKEEDSREIVGQALFVKKRVLAPRKWKDISVVTSDYQLPRVKTIFDFVLGNGFGVEYVAAKTGKEYDECVAFAELAKTRAFIETFYGVRPADDLAIEQIVRECSPYKN